MGKILVSNQMKDFSALNNFFANSGFRKAYENMSPLNLSTYYKLRVQGVNSFKRGHDYIVGVGTYIFNDQIAEKALEGILELYMAGVSVSELQMRILGAYCLCICVDGKLTIFVDANSLYAIYYYNSNNRFILTNSYYHIAKIIGDQKINGQNLVEKELLLGDVYGDETIYTDIYALNGDQAIVYDHNDFSVVPITKVLIANDDSELSESLYKTYKTLPKAFSKVSMLVTGGSDSRMVASLLTKLGFCVNGFYFMGNSYELPSRQGDKNTAEALMEILKHDFTVIQCPTNKTTHEYRQSLMYRYGELSTIWGGNPAYFSTLENRIDCDFIELGQYGEILNCTPINRVEDNITIRDFVDSFMISVDAGNIQYVKSNDLASDSYKHIIKKWSNFCSNVEIDPSNIKKDELALLDIELRKKRDRGQLNLMNCLFYSFPLLAQPFVINKVANVSWSNKQDLQFKIKTTLALDEKAYDVPLYSHTKLYSYDKRTEQLIAKDNPFLLRLRSSLVGRINNPTLLYLTKSVYYKLMHDKKGYDDLKRDQKRKNELLRNLRAKRTPVDLEPLKLFSFGKLSHISAVIDLIDDCNKGNTNA